MNAAIAVPRSPAARLLLSATAVGLVLLAGTVLLRSPPPVSAPLPAARAMVLKSGVPQNYDEAVTRADEAVDGAARRVAAMPGQWLPLESLGRAQFDRARLTGDLASYVAARDSFDKAFAGLDPQVGPHMSHAEFSMGVHRLAAAAADLDIVDRYAVPPDAAERAQILAMRGDIAFYRGDYDGARRAYAAAARIAPSAGIEVRMATLSMRLGQADEALADLDRASRVGTTTIPQIAARIELQRGLIERGRGDWDAATRHFDAALALYPDWWVADGQRAAMSALAGDMPGAIRRFMAIAARTGQPEPMDALAALYRASGDVGRSRQWAARADTLWNQRLAAFPEAFAGHAIDHHLAFGDPGRALALARAAQAARPFGETTIALANAWLVNGRPDTALTLIERVDASGWVSAEQHLVAAQALAMLGRGDDAERRRTMAVAVDRHASDRNPALLWFDH